MYQLTIHTPRFKYECVVKEWPDIQSQGHRMMYVRYTVNDAVVVKYLSTEGLDIDVRKLP